jgi:hypothetical protein
VTPAHRIGTDEGLLSHHPQAGVGALDGQPVGSAVRRSSFGNWTEVGWCGSPSEVWGLDPIGDLQLILTGPSRTGRRSLARLAVTIPTHVGLRRAVARSIGLLSPLEGRQYHEGAGSRRAGPRITGRNLPVPCLLIECMQAAHSTQPVAVV